MSRSPFLREWVREGDEPEVVAPSLAFFGLTRHATVRDLRREYGSRWTLAMDAGDVRELSHLFDTFIRARRELVRAAK